MVRISELHESDDDSMERLNLDDYNSDDYDEYLSDNMEATPTAITEVKTTIKQDPPLAPPAVTVTIQLEAGLKIPTGTGPVWPVIGQTGSGWFRFRPVSNRPKFKIQI